MKMSDVYNELRDYFKDLGGVTVSSGSGAQGIKSGGKMLVMFIKGDILVKLSPERVAEVIDSGDGVRYDPGTGKPMKNRVLIPASNKDKWIKYSLEAIESK